MDYNYSKSKGQTEAGDTFASSINMGPSDRNYTSDYVDNEPIGKSGDVNYGTENNPIQLGWWPVKLESFTVEADSGEVIGIADPTTGEISGTGVSGKVTPDGKLYLTFDAATKTEPVVRYNFNNEDIRSDGPISAGFTNVPEVELKINSLPVEAKARTLRTYWALTA